MGTNNFARNGFSHREFSASYDDVIKADKNFEEDTKEFSDGDKEQLMEDLNYEAALNCREISSTNLDRFLSILNVDTNFNSDIEVFMESGYHWGYRIYLTVNDDSVDYHHLNRKEKREIEKLKFLQKYFFQLTEENITKQFKIYLKEKKMKSLHKLT